MSSETRILEPYVAGRGGGWDRMEMRRASCLGTILLHVGQGLNTKSLEVMQVAHLPSPGFGYLYIDRIHFYGSLEV